MDGMKRCIRKDIFLNVMAQFSDNLSGYFIGHPHTYPLRSVGSIWQRTTISSYSTPPFGPLQFVHKQFSPSRTTCSLSIPRQFHVFCKANILPTLLEA
ncbi:hypothetical protein BDV36DRAFT_46367 [Aspergillus pseudocaelatus]|uniref:Uncharacterized protein n=1 Tax=Aspergillus pseudocaelatus TaxID=1825620 RepID=A0ABQ6W730_9EURO|nr:hypothetical protein BDV36DRAFT_46367 [Aspergillus pseudocaelatus]